MVKFQLISKWVSILVCSPNFFDFHRDAVTFTVQKHGSELKVQ